MKERTISPTEKYDAVLDSVNYRAQEAILDPNLPDAFKDEIVGLAIDTIRKVAERKVIYNAKYGAGRRSRRPR
jgi:hypothetical protein